MEILSLIWEPSQFKIVVKVCLNGLMKHLVKDSINEKELEMANIPLISLDERILGLRKIAVLEWVNCLKSNPSQWEGQEDMPFTNPRRHKY